MVGRAGERGQGHCALLAPGGSGSIGRHGAMMQMFAPLDLIGLACFIAAWSGYAVVVEWTARGRGGLNGRMGAYREIWMRRMLARDMRMVDMQLMASLQTGTAFFASTSLIAIGGALTLLRSTDEIQAVVTALAFGIPVSRGLWETKTIGLVVIFAYAFFKFSWSYRLYAYGAILLGAMPFPADKDTPEAEAHVLRTARLFEFGRPAFQSRPARFLLRARLSRLVRRPDRLAADDGTGGGDHVAPAIHLGRAPRRQHRRGRVAAYRAARAQVIPITTEATATTRTAIAAAATVAAVADRRSSRSRPALVAGARGTAKARAGRI